LLITGGGPSIARAVIMGEITLVGLLFERESSPYSALALSAFILLLINPWDLFNIGFQLSFAATWSLFYLKPILNKALERIFKQKSRRAAELLALSLAPIMATAPLIAYYFGQLSCGALISNLLVLPWIEYLVILGCFSTLVGAFFLPLAKILGNTLWLMLIVLDGVARYVAIIPGSSLYIRPPSLALVVGYYILLGLLAEAVKREIVLKLNFKRGAFLGLFLIAVFVWHGAASERSFAGQGLLVTFLDVRQGDCILLETPAGKKILIDGGGQEDGSKPRGERDPIGQKIVVPFLRRKGIKELDLAVLTHFHADHQRGLKEVMREIRIKKLLTNRRCGFPQTIKFEPGLTGQILSPNCFTTGQWVENDHSVVIKVVYGRTSFLLTGDLAKEGEEGLLSIGADLRADVLKIGHHGSQGATSDRFLETINPKVAVISVGKKNRYRHPHPVTLKKLAGLGIKILRTDCLGTIRLFSNGQKIVALAERGNN